MKLSDQDILAEIAKNDPSANMRRKAVKKLKDQAALGEVAQNDQKTDIRMLALKKLTDQDVIGEVAKSDQKTDIRMFALKKLTDQAALGEVAQNDRKTDVRRRALKKLTDRAALGEVAQNDKNMDNRRIALKILKKITNRAAKLENVYLLTGGNKDDAGKNAEIDVIIEKISSAARSIDMISKSIDDKTVSGEISSIKNILAKIAAFLNEEREKTDIGQRIGRMDQFLNYYIPATIKILESYRQINEYKLEGGNALETKKRIAASMPVIRSAFEKELDSTYENKMIDITTDIDVLEAMLAKDGILILEDFSK
ncbi:MAG: hypothetical protein FWG34_09250 [Oscillospiraceae bacterium]|nr:hypothetical protein [Oscillospiraceae bacterium]